MGAQRLYFIDWMKAIGIVLIVYDHLVGSTINFMTPPILPKQIGVSCFLFVLAYVLARERRPVWEVIVRRLFTLYLVGVGTAVILSLCGLMTHGRLQLSNYLPFLGGANVLILQNAFPANPTTWYIATYVHVVLLWALIGRRLRVRLWMLPCAAVGEVVVRLMLADAAGPYVAYMALPNWLTVLLWGTWLGQHADDVSTNPAECGMITRSAVILTILLVFWPIAGSSFKAYPGFPFEAIGVNAPLAISVYASAVVTLLYVSYVSCLFRLSRRLPTPFPVPFLAHNTLVIFIGHMPVFWVLAPIVEPQLSFWAAKIAEVLICVFGLGVASELIFRVINVESLRNQLFSIRPVAEAAQEL